MQGFLSLVLFLAAASTLSIAASTADAEVKDVIQKFQQALESQDVAAIGNLVSLDIVVFENGHRNNGWPDFRDNHLLPEFKEPAKPSKWGFVKVAATSELAWAYTKQSIGTTGTAERWHLPTLSDI